MSKYIFVDESGNADLETHKKGASSYYIVCSVIVEKQDIDSFKNGVENISNKYFNGREIKSSSISQSQRRFNIIKDIVQLPFKWSALVVDKNRLNKQKGFQYKRSFYKFFPRHLFEATLKNINTGHIFADNLGTNEFQQELKAYHEKRFREQYELFGSDLTIDFVDSKSELSIGISDFIAGTLHKINSGNDDFSLIISQYLDQRKSNLIPYPYHDEKPKIGEFDTDNDKIIEYYAREKAVEYINSNAESEDESILHQVFTLQFLLHRFDFDNKNRYSYSDEIIRYLNEIGFSGISKQYFKSQIIAKLRDENILVASSASGYKIPSCTNEVVGYVTRQLSVIKPMISRLKLANQQIKVITNNEINLFEIVDDGLLRVIDSTTSTVLSS